MRLATAGTIIILTIIAASLQGCNALGGVPSEAIANTKTAAASCIRANGLWGSGVVTMANADRGSLVDGSITVNPENCGMVIVNRPKPEPAIASPRQGTPPALP